MRSVIPASADDRAVAEAFDRHKRGDLDSAVRVYRDVLARNPAHPQALHYLGLVAQQTGHSKEAASLIRRSIEIHPGDVRAHNHLGQVHVALGDKQAARAAFERAVELDPQHVDSLNNLANVIKARDGQRAIDLYRQALELKPNAVYAIYNLAMALNENGEFDEALSLFERAVALEPQHVAALQQLAVLREQKGRFGAAVDLYRRILKVAPRHGPATANLIASRAYEPDDDTVRNARALIEEGAISPDERIKLHHGLGKHHDRLGEYDEAFRHFSECKQSLRMRSPYFDVDEHARQFDRLIETFSSNCLSTRQGRGNSSRRPVFIVGLPRSGTTLVEQILASHPLIFGAGELTEMPRIVKSLRPDYPGSVPQMPDAELAALATQYLAKLDARAPSESVRVTDKMPTNALHIGLIATLLPEARIIYCRRDPRDIGLSCFIELFELEHGYTTDLTTFARYFLEHQRLMAHWCQAWSRNLHVVRYEDLVATTEVTSRALVAHCGLGWDPACLRFAQVERTVQTPSRWQVRQPVYTTSVGRWRNYASHLEPLITVLNEHGYAYEAALA